MYRLFIGNKNYSSWSLRPWILMREREIAFEERLVPFQGEATWAEFRRFSPTGRVPCLHDGDAAVWDSLGIVEYLAERHPAVWPEDPRARAWARCAASEMHSGFQELRTRCPMSCGMRVRLAAPTPALGRDLARIAELWQEGLARHGGPFLAGGRFTAVDAFFMPVAFRVQTYGLELPQAAAAYARRMLERPAMRGWHADALAETWRDEPHDAEIRASGTVIADLRAAGSPATA